MTHIRPIGTKIRVLYNSVSHLFPEGTEAEIVDYDGEYYVCIDKDGLKQLLEDREFETTI